MYAVPIIALLLFSAFYIHIVIYAHHLWSWSNSDGGSSKVEAHIMAGVASMMFTVITLLVELMVGSALDMQLQYSSGYLWICFILACFVDTGVGIWFTYWLVTRQAKAKQPAQ
jgi:uncharacterized membrane protein